MRDILRLGDNGVAPPDGDQADKIMGLMGLSLKTEGKPNDLSRPHASEKS
jgi:hypothetical protein